MSPCSRCTHLQTSGQLPSVCLNARYAPLRLNEIQLTNSDYDTQFTWNESASTCHQRRLRFRMHIHSWTSWCTILIAVPHIKDHATFASNSLRQYLVLLRCHLLWCLIAVYSSAQDFCKSACIIVVCANLVCLFVSLLLYRWIGFHFVPPTDFCLLVELNKQRVPPCSGETA